MTKETDEYGKTNEYKYDVDGNLLSHKNPDGKTIQYAYDKFNNIKQVKDANGKTISYTWDIFGNKTSISYKNTCIKYAYNEMNKVTKVSKGNTEIASYSYDQRGNTCVLMPEYDDSDWYAKDVSYVLDKTFENSEILATDDGEINIYGQTERLMSDRQSRDGTSKATKYLNGNNNSVYAKLETEMTWYGPKEKMMMV